MSGMSDRAKPWVIATGVGVVALAAVLIGDSLVPKPRPKLGPAALARQEAKLIETRAQTQKDFVAEKARNEARTWPGPIGAIHPAAIANLAQAAKRHRLRLVSVRPQRAESEADLTRIPYLVALEGPFPKVASFVNEFSVVQGRLALTGVQINTADPASDKVAATVTVVAFMKGAVEETKTRG